MRGRGRLGEIYSVREVIRAGALHGEIYGGRRGWESEELVWEWGRGREIAWVLPFLSHMLLKWGGVNYEYKKEGEAKEDGRE